MELSCALSDRAMQVRCLRTSSGEETLAATGALDPDSTFGPMPSRKHQSYNGLTDAFRRPAAAQDPRVSDLIQSGKLRVGIGLGTPLAVKNPTTGEVRGPTIDLGRALSARIGIDLVAIEYPRPGAVIEAAGSNAWDVAFLVVDANRAKQADFSQPYLQTDSTYLVLADSSIHNAADADQPGIRIAVPRGDGSDLELTRVLKRAELVRTDTIDAALELVRVGSAHGRAGPRPGPACGVSQAARLSRS